MNIFHDKVPLDEPENTFDFPLRFGFTAIKKRNPKLGSVLLIIRFSSLACRLELRPTVRKDGFREATPNECVIHHLKDVYPILAIEPLAIGNKSTVIIHSTDQIQVADQR